MLQYFCRHFCLFLILTCAISFSSSSLAVKELENRKKFCGTIAAVETEGQKNLFLHQNDVRIAILGASEKVQSQLVLIAAARFRFTCVRGAIVKKNDQRVLLVSKVDRGKSGAGVTIEPADDE